MNRSAALLIGVSFVAGLGSTAMSLVAGIWVLSLTGSSALAALAGFFVFAPTLLGPVLGAIADRVPVRPVLVTTNLALGGLLATLQAVDDAGDVWHIFAVMLAYGLAHVVLDAAETRLVVAAVPPDALGRLGGLRLGAQEATKLVAPLLGAGLFVLAGGAAVALLSAGTLAAAAVLYLVIRARPVAASAPRDRRMWTDVVAGLRYLRSQPLVWRPVLVATLAMLASGLGTAGLYSVVANDLSRPPAFLGVLSAVQGGGAILGGLAVGWLMTRLGGEAAVAALGAGVFALGPLAQATGWLPAALAGSAFVGLGLPWSVVAAFTAVQRHTPAAMLGTVTGSATTLVFAPPVLGLPLGALLVSTVDHRIPLALAAVCALGAVAHVLRRAPRVRAGVPGGVA
jgi:Major Facilitator Superfamily